MGMTIEDARTALGKERKYALHENKQAFDIAIDTMRKYKRITQIVKEWEFDHESMVDSMEKISNVMKED